MFNQLKSHILTIVVFLTFAIGISSLLAQNNVVIKPIFPDVESSTIYEVKFTASVEIAAKAMFKLTFPASFDLSKVRMAGSETINGGFSVKLDKKKVLITRSGLGRVVKTGEAVKFQFATVKNPEKADNYEIRFEVVSGTGEPVLQQRSQVKIVSRRKAK